MLAVAAVPALSGTDRDSPESDEETGQTLLDVANDVEAGEEVDLGTVSGRDRGAQWLRAVHRNLLKRVLVHDADAVSQQRSDSYDLQPHLPGGDRVVAGRMLIRSTDDGDHVLLMGSVTMILDPLCCPYASVGQCPERFASSDCRKVKAHLQSAHHLNDFRFNLLCPFSGETAGKRRCRQIMYDPKGLMLCSHVVDRDAHADFADEITLSLDNEFYQAFVTGSPEQRLYSRQLPPWVLELQDKLPSQDIPETACIPTFVKDGALWYECKQPGCVDAVFATVHALFDHLDKCHKITVGQSELLHACPAAASQDCRVTLRFGSPHMLLHVQADHAELLGMSGQYSARALQKRAKLEERVEKEVKWAKQQLAEMPPGPGGHEWRMHALRCPVPCCAYTVHEEDVLLWHVGAVHRTMWNVT